MSWLAESSIYKYMYWLKKKEGLIETGQGIHKMRNTMGDKKRVVIK